MSFTGVTFDAWLPWWGVAVLAALALAMAGYLLYRRAPGSWLRLAFLAVVVLAVLNPRLIAEERRPLSDVALVITDRSLSQTLTERDGQAEAAAAALAERLSDEEGVELREAVIDASGEDTSLLPALRQALAGIDAERLGAVALVTDGQVHDLEGLDGLPFEAPLHVLLTGSPGEVDREAELIEAPTYALVGEPFELRVRVEDHPAPEDNGQARGSASVRVLLGGQVVRERQVRVGDVEVFDLSLDRAGESVIAIEAETLEGEVSAVNNTRHFRINGIRDRLRVLLVSGQPYPGLRVWRNVLKADPTVDLVHFTILRPPEKQDGTPIDELALIAFPSRELFEEKLDGFDLIIFDRYARRGLLPLVYLDNVARYVEEGGALLEAAGPEFAQSSSLFRTPLARVLPGRPSGEVIERRLVPAVTDTGKRHPVTQALLEGGETPDWGPWYRQVDVETDDVQVLIEGAAERPLLVLKRVGEGRVAQLLSDHAWLWARGVEGGGPHAAMLRRVLHWLMREPELEEERLQARADESGVRVERSSLEPIQGEARVRLPDGTTRSVELVDDGERGVGLLDADQPGFYEVTHDGLVTYAAGRELPQAETADLRATPDLVADLASGSGGGTRWLEDGEPAVRAVGARGTASGASWIGVRANDASTVEGRRETPLMPPLLAFLLLTGLAAGTWWREGRG